MDKSRYIQSAFALLVLLCLPASARAQSKRWEHNIYQGMGWVNKFVKEDEQNIALHVGYGINYHIDSRWSLMPGVGLRLKGFGHDNENAGNCSSTYIDFPILVQYHFGGEKRQGIVLECGPVLSFRAHGEKYHGGADWWLPHPFNGKQEYRKFDLGVRPAVYYETKNWRFGVQSHVSLLDTKCKYHPPYDWEHGFGQFDDERYFDSKLGHRYYAFDIVATICYHW